jgi:hypothetical protein
MGPKFLLPRLHKLFDFVVIQSKFHVILRFSRGTSKLRWLGSTSFQNVKRWAVFSLLTQVERTEWCREWNNRFHLCAAACGCHWVSRDAYALKWRDRLSLALVKWRLQGITPEYHCLGGKWKIARGSKRTVGCKNNFFRKWCRYEYYIVLGRNAPIPGATSRLCRPNVSTLALNFYESSVRNLHHIALLTPIFWC